MHKILFSKISPNCKNNDHFMHNITTPLDRPCRTPQSMLMAIPVLNIQPILPIIVCHRTSTRGGASFKLKDTNDNQCLSIM